ncbi:MAG: esterase/lipase family protein [Chthoniobacterales bacterium]
MQVPYSKILPVIALVLLGAGCATTSHKPQDPLTAARSSLRQAEKKDSVGLYLTAAQQALAVAVNEAQPAATRDQATRIYDSAVAECAAALGTQKVMSVVSCSGTSYVVSFDPPPKIDHLVVSDKIERKHMKQDVRRAGFGGTLVGLLDGPATTGPNRPPKGYSVPWTAVAEFGKTAGDRTPVTIRFINPREHDSVRLAGADRPLAADFTAQLAIYPRVNELIFGALSMLRSDRSISRSGLLFCEPYDPDRIPVIFVHGLMSSPHAWLQVANQLNADPDFRRRYQVWWYFYPTGAPIAGNAMMFREALTEVAKRYPLRHKLVIVGHSMGGILTRMQVTNSGREVWNAIFRDNADKVYAQVPADSIIKRALIWKANPNVSRVVFIATPHLGSRLANLRAAGFAASLIRMPITLSNTFNSQIAKVLPLIDPSLRRLPTSIRGLSPDNRLLVAVDKLKLTVPCNSIIGNRGRNDQPLADSSDGVVSYWSSHLKQAESEIIVPTGHDAFNNPASIVELERIFAQ